MSRIHRPVSIAPGNPPTVERTKSLTQGGRKLLTGSRVRTTLLVMSPSPEGPRQVVVKKLRERKAIDALRASYPKFPDGRIEAT